MSKNLKQRMPVTALLAGAAVIAGWWSYGWKGLVLAFTVIVFWAVLQFNRATRVLRNAGQRPKGQVDSVTMLQARLEPGLSLLEVLQITGSLGEARGHDEWGWRDPYGNEAVLVFRRERLVRWSVARAEAEAPAEPADPDAPPDFGPPDEAGPQRSR